jgi:broad specificity phosphatase PhoE
MHSRKLISFIRHGHVHNPQELFYGRLPRFRLDEEGIRQAQTVSRLLKDRDLNAIFSSPLLRTRRTAEIILAMHPGLVLRQSKLLKEVYSPYDGHPNQEVIDRGWDIYSGVPARYEQPLDVLSRTQKFVTRIRNHYAGRHVIAVTHGDLIAFMILWAHGAAVNQKNKQDLRPYGVPDQYPVPGSITTLEFRSAAPNELPGVEYRGNT